MKKIIISIICLLNLSVKTYAMTTNESLIGKGIVSVPQEHPLLQAQGMIGLVNNIGCTVFMVGPRHAMTASHCFGEWPLINVDNLKFGSSFATIINFVGYGDFKVVAYKKNKIEYSGSKSARYFTKDYAILELAPVANSKFPPYFEMRDSWGNSKSVFMASNKWNYINKVESFTFNTSECLTKNIQTKKQSFSFLGKFSFLISDCAIDEGMSGGPLLFEEDGNFYVNGINIAGNGEGNQSTETYSIQFTKEMIQEINDWIAAH